LPASAAGTSGRRNSTHTVRYEVTITNLTPGQQFTPILLATHDASVSLFTLGQPASTQLGTLATTGNPAPLAALLNSTPGVREVVTGTGFTNPGRSITFDIDAGFFDRLSVAAMLIPTNASFFALNGVELPFFGYERDVTLYSPAYDSGTEKEDELCADIPGPFFAECGGPGGGGQPGGGDGFVHISSGIHGVGDFTTALRDWRNPVAKIVIKRVR
ncbi:MAG: spondin domain-containing protein, partial [Rhodanobacteraceae bacterium]